MHGASAAHIVEVDSNGGGDSATLHVAEMVAVVAARVTTVHAMHIPAQSTAGRPIGPAGCVSTALARATLSSGSVSLAVPTLLITRSCVSAASRKRNATAMSPQRAVWTLHTSTLMVTGQSGVNGPSVQCLVEVDSSSVSALVTTQGLLAQAQTARELLRKSETATPMSAKSRLQQKTKSGQSGLYGPFATTTMNSTGAGLAWSLTPAQASAVGSPVKVVCVLLDRRAVSLFFCRFTIGFLRPHIMVLPNTESLNIGYTNSV